LPDRRRASSSPLGPQRLPFERWCEQAGVESEATELAPDGTVTFRSRQVPLVRYQSTPRRTSTLWLTFDINRRFYSDKPGRLMFTETHRPTGTDDGRFLDSVVLSETEIPALLQALSVLVDEPPVPANIEDQLVACFRNLIARGQLGPHLRLRENSERVGTWCQQAGVPFTAAASERRETLAEAPRSADDTRVTLSLRLGGREGLLFEETHRVGHDFANQSRYTVTADYAHLPALVERLASRADLPAALTNHLEQRLGPADPTTNPDDRLIACFARLVEQGALGDGQPLRANRDKVFGISPRPGYPRPTTMTTGSTVCVDIGTGRGFAIRKPHRGY
jgi:hypothetical protein